MKSYLYAHTKSPDNRWILPADDMVILAVWYAKHAGPLQPCEDGTYHVWNSNMPKGILELDPTIQIMDDRVRELINDRTWPIRVEGQ